MKNDNILSLAQNFEDIAKQEYDRIQSIQKSKEQGKIGPVPVRMKGRRGGGLAGAKINQFNEELATFNGLATQLNEKVNSALHTAKQGVTQYITSQKTKAHNELKPYVDRLSKAIQNGDKKMKYDAIRLLKEKMSEHPTRLGGLALLEKVARLQPYFNKIKADLLKISQWINQSERLNITPARMAFILDTIQYSARLNEIYNKYYPEFGRTRLPYHPTLKVLEKVISRLNEIIESSYKTLEESGATGPRGLHE